MDYTELDQTAQETAIRGRLRDLEAQHLQLALRVNNPALGEVASEQDRASLKSLEDSITKLRSVLDGVAKPQEASK